MKQVDVVVVSFNSRAVLRSCVEPLASGDGLRVIEEWFAGVVVRID